MCARSRQPFGCVLDSRTIVLFMQSILLVINSWNGNDVDISAQDFFFFFHFRFISLKYGKNMVGGNGNKNGQIVSR